MRRHAMVSVVASCAIFTLVSLALAKHEKSTVVRFHSATEVMAPPAAVWAHMTTGKNLVTWCPMWKSPKNAAINLVRVGDVLDFTDEWGNGGRSIVTYVVKDREIRVAHEPQKGDYMCQAKLILTPTANGTRVTYLEQYTDDSALADLEATAAKTEAQMASTLAALKKSVEKK